MLAGVDGLSCGRIRSARRRRGGAEARSGQRGGGGGAARRPPASCRLELLPSHRLDIHRLDFTSPPTPLLPLQVSRLPRRRRHERGGEETKKMTTMRRWGEEVVSLSLRGHGYGDEDDDRPKKPRRYGVTEMRSPIYSFRPTHDALQEILGSLGPFVDGLKFSGGSHSLMGKELVREITDLAHKHDIYVSTGDWADHLLRQGPSTFKQYVEECRALGFDTIELNAGSLKLPEEALLRLVHLIKNSGLRAKPLFSVKFDSSDIPASGDRAFGAYMAPVKHSSVGVLAAEAMDNLALVWGIIGPGAAGAVFGAGWCFWVDAVVCSAVQVSFLHYLPGIFASLAALMFNCVNKDEIGYDYYSPYGDDSEWRVKLWLFVAYVVSFVCLAGAVGLLVQDALTDKGPSVWTGVAGVLQCVLVLISGLIYWTCHSED